MPSKRPASPSGEAQFAAAVQAHQQGRLAEADGLYRKLVLAEPPHPGALHYSGVLALQRGDAARAADLIARSLAQRERNPEGHYHLGLAFAALGRFAETLTHNERAVALQPDYAAAHMNRGNALKALGRLAEAEAAYARTIALAPGFAEAHFNLGNLRADRGRIDEALAAYDRALQARPAYPEALNNSAAALVMRGRSAEAIARFRQALALRPDFVEAMVGQAMALLAAEDHYGALALVTRALSLRPSDEAKLVFLALARTLAACPEIPQLRDVLMRAISEAWARPRLFARFAGVVLSQTGPVADLLARPAHDVLAPAELAALAADPLLRVLMEATAVADPRLEGLLTAARRGLVALRDDEVSADILDFACALARQCFINEYVFAETRDERAQTDALSETLAAACRADAAIAPLTVALVAAYRPLGGESAHLLARPWPEPVERLLTQQIREPLAEARLRETMPRLTEIADDVSIAVRQQYEESPYPRWVRIGQVPHAVPIDLHLRRQLPAAQFTPLGKEDIAILTVGCGTGQHHIEFAHAVRHAEILAVDLSLASLAFAKRKSDELGLTSIAYGQADILRLPEIGRSFDVIVAGGVLHHMADPFAAWRGLTRLLRPGGVMNLGLYSALARANVVEARAFIAENGFAADADGIRRARAALAALPADAPMRRLTHSADFYSMSECRDLLFHVQEHRLTLPQIQTFLEETGLRFLGFELGRDMLARYAAQAPHDRTLSDLASWDAFEHAFPRTFLGMYQFWVQKPA